MEISLFQGIIITIAVMILAIDNQLEGFFIFRPIIVAPIIGALLGDINTGLIAGGLVELSFAGITAVGGVTPPNAIICSAMTVVLAKTTGQGVEMAFTLAYPFGLLMQQISTLYNTVLVVLNKKAEKYAEKCDVKGLFKLCFYGILGNSLLYGLVIFLSAYVAQDAMRELVNALPEFLTHGLSVAGGLIPAIGFAMLLRVMLKARYVPYLLAGFLFASFIEMNNILPVAIMGLIFALLTYYNNNEVKEVKGVVNDGEGI